MKNIVIFTYCVAICLLFVPFRTEAQYPNSPSNTKWRQLQTGVAAAKSSVIRHCSAAIDYLKSEEPIIPKMGNCTCGIRKTSRVLSGLRAKFSEFPWLVKILRHNRQYCVGFVITAKHVLSAGHCFVNSYTSLKMLFADKRVHPIKCVTIHKKWRRYNTYIKHDLAIVEVLTPLHLGKQVVPICFPEHLDDFTGSWGLVAGWGTAPENRNSTEELKKVYLPVLSKEECSKAHYVYPKTDKIFCAGFMEGFHDTCDGDNGGPLMVRGRRGEIIAAGVISFDKGCGRPNHPSMSMKVSNYLNWIYQTIGDEPVCSPP